jgi:DNA-binding NtrC family response regulator
MTYVLLVDHQPDMRRLVRDILEDDGYTVVETRDTPTALDALRNSPDAMVGIFGMTMGTSLLQAAVEEASVRRHAFVLLTATPELLTPLWRVLLAALDVPVVAKPFAIDTLLATVADATARINHPNGRRGGRPIPA